MYKNFLVTGGAGFIGSHLIDALLTRGYNVLNIDKLDNNSNLKIKEESINNHLNHQNYSLLKKDFTDVEFIKMTLADFKPDVVIHLAAKTDIEESVKDPETCFNVNILGTLNLLRLAAHCNVKKFIFSSSAAVYGISEKIPLIEDESLLSPLSPYAVSKIAGEGLCHVYKTLYPIQCICLRFFNAYGPKQPSILLTYKFTKLITQGLPVPIYGDGNHTRDFVYVSDIVKGILLAINFKEKNYEIFNISGSSQVSVLQVINILEKEIGKKAKLEFLKPKECEITKSFANCSKAKTLLGYEAEIPIELGIKKFVTWFNQNNQ